MAKNELLFRDSKKIKCHLDLTGVTDKIVCICGKYAVIDFHLTKLKKKNLVMAFVNDHQKCEK